MVLGKKSQVIKEGRVAQGYLGHKKQCPPNPGVTSGGQHHNPGVISGGQYHNPVVKSGGQNHNPGVTPGGAREEVAGHQGGARGGVPVALGHRRPPYRGTSRAPSLFFSLSLSFLSIRLSLFSLSLFLFLSLSLPLCLSVPPIFFVARNSV